MSENEEKNQNTEQEAIEAEEIVNEEDAALEELAEQEAAKQEILQQEAQKEQTPEETTLESENKKLETPVMQQPKKKKTGLWIGIGVAAVLITAAIVVGLLFLDFGLSEDKRRELFENGTYLDGVSIYDENVGGMTRAQASEVVGQKLMDYDGNETLLTLLFDGETIDVSAKDLETENTLETVLNEAMLHGREGSYMQRRKLASETAQNGKNFIVSISTDDDILEGMVTNIVETYSVPVKEADVNLNTGGGDLFVYSDPVPGKKINGETLKAQIKQQIANNNDQPIEVDFAVEQPTTTVEDLKANMVLIGNYSTSVGGGASRQANVAKAGATMNGTKVMPGETYDLEADLGPRTAANGWNQANEIVNNEFVPGYGGGICQASTTLFNAVLEADLEIVERSNHSLTIGYVPYGFDAAISAGGPLFVFRNDTDYPIFIVADSGSLSTMTVKIYGRPHPWGETQFGRDYQILSSGAGGAKKVKAILTYKDKNGNVQKTRSWESNYSSKKDAVSAQTDTVTQNDDKKDDNTGEDNNNDDNTTTSSRKTNMPTNIPGLD